MPRNSLPAGVTVITTGQERLPPWAKKIFTQIHAYLIHYLTTELIKIYGEDRAVDALEIAMRHLEQRDVMNRIWAGIVHASPNLKSEVDEWISEATRETQKNLPAQKIWNRSVRFHILCTSIAKRVEEQVSKRYQWWLEIAEGKPAPICVDIAIINAHYGALILHEIDSGTTTENVLEQVSRIVAADCREIYICRWWDASQKNFYGHRSSGWWSECDRAIVARERGRRMLYGYEFDPLLRRIASIETTSETRH